MKILVKRYYYHFLNKSRFLFNNYFGKYKYTFDRDWFYKSEIYQTAKYFLDYKNKLEILEIGSYEVLSTTYFINNFLSKPNSKISVVDPFLLYSENNQKKILDNIQIRNFFFNV